MNVKCSICGRIFEFYCKKQSCKPSEKMQQHIEEHNQKGETVQWIIS